MSNLLEIIENFFSAKKYSEGHLVSDRLLQLDDFQDIYNYFQDNIKYYLSIEHTIEGFDRSVNKPNWVVMMCEEFQEKISAYRQANNKSAISLQDVFLKEEKATTEKDYPLRFALYCTDLCLK